MQVLHPPSDNYGHVHLYDSIACQQLDAFALLTFKVFVILTVSQVNTTVAYIANIVLYTNDVHGQRGLSSGRGWDKVGKLSVIKFFINKGVVTHMLASFQTVNYRQNSTFSH